MPIAHAVDGMGQAAMIDRTSIRPWLAVIGSVLSFGLLIEPTGVVPAVIVSVLVASRGSHDLTLRQALVLGACLAVAVGVLFVVALGQPFPLVTIW
jgi:hypothetical protein